MKNKHELITLQEVLAGEDGTDLPEALDVVAEVIQSLADRLRDSDEDELLSASQVADYLGTTVRWVYRNGHKLGATKLSHRCTRYPRDRVRSFARMRQR